MEIIETDTLARYFRQRGAEVRFQTGTDEHGIKMQKHAQEKQVTLEALCAENSAQYQALRQALNLSFTDFIRTSDQTRHFPAVQAMWQRLLAAGKLEKRNYQGVYCAGCEAFLLPKDLVEGQCPIHPSLEVEKVMEANWFFRLADFSAQIVALIESGKLKIVPKFRSTEFLNLAKQGLTDVSFSRPRTKLDWGVPVPNDPTQTMYVWCDALTNYISALGFGSTQTSEFAKFWQDPTARQIHVIGKDIVRFHAGIWIGMLLAADLPLPTEILVHGFLTSEGQKMSKTLGNVITPADLAQEFGADALRYYLLAEIPLGQDGDFTQQRFREVYEAELADSLGNLLTRVVTLARKIETDLQVSQLEAQLTRAITKMWEELEKAMTEFNFRAALAAIFQLINFTNKFINQVQPWKLAGAEKVASLVNLLEILRQVGLALQPFLPETAERILATLGLAETQASFGKSKQSQGQQFQPRKPPILFPKN